MTREWKPGDVAMATFDHGGTGYVFRIVGAPSNWCDMAGVAAPDGQVTDIRPLVVIDPDDRQQVERLLGYYVAPFDDFVTDGRLDHMQAALREFANPTPPKPEEPTGLGAVVEDADGVRWVRVGSTYAWEHAATDEAGDHYVDSGHYADIAAVRVLSSGVTP